MSFVSPEDGLGTIAYKAKGFRIVHEPKRPDANPYPFKDFSKVTYVCGDGWLIDKVPRGFV